MIRLQRVGRKNDPSFRVVVADSRRSAKSGKCVEILGSYDPRKDKKTLKADRVAHWLSHGAQASGTMHNLLVSEGIIKEKKINVLPKKRPIMKEKQEKTDKKPKSEEASAETEKSEAPEKEEKDSETKETPEETQSESPTESKTLQDIKEEKKAG